VTRQVRFGATEEELLEIQEYVGNRHKWKDVSAFLRYAVFTEMRRNASGAHRSKKEAEEAPSPGRSTAPRLVGEPE
jgi:hypothetical protein